MAIELNQGECLVENTKDGSRKFEPKLKRVDFCDRRVYERSEELYYPSVTSVLSCLPVDPFFLQWLQDMGANANIVRDRAAREGTQVHEGIEDLLKGEKLEWQDGYGNAKYNLLVWKMLLKFQEFFNNVKPETLALEQFLYSDEYKYAGTTDYLCKIEGKTWLLDFKTSNSLHMLSYGAQLAAYAKALEEIKGIKVDRCGILWLKASTRTLKINHSKGIYQGQGWQIVPVDDLEKNFKVFTLARQMYDIVNPGDTEPYNISYPTEISLEV